MGSVLSGAGTSEAQLSHTATQWWSWDFISSRSELPAKATLHPSENQRGGGQRAGNSWSLYKALGPLVSSPMLHPLAGQEWGFQKSHCLYGYKLCLGSFLATFLMMTDGDPEEI